ANTTGGSAVQMNDQFEAAGFKMGSPTNAAGAEIQLDVSKVYFTRGNTEAREVATTAARLMGGVKVQRMPEPIPVQDGEIDGEVLVMLGVDAAGKTLDELTAAPGGPVDTTAEVTTPTTG
ncbi:MAG: LytR C-terminal domain-containing protein, partial [Actinomycetota bacterium]|nr:LytR C-terminal domain-containing protein [Actinomycetota bacterium]